ncbi:MAG: hypothetical protein Q7T62_02175 [Undibacterium sp.]|nr:hypothetical protein [Undibacterium sp.]
MERKLNYSIFGFLQENVGHLRNLRPDLYMSPAQDSSQILGSLVERLDFAEIMNSNFPIVQSINTSIVLNTTGFFEGLLENILLRKIGSISHLPDPISAIASDYKDTVIRISSLDGFKKHFRKLFGVNLSEILSAHHQDLKFIEKFYLIRHLLTHGSTIDTSSYNIGNGMSLRHVDPDYLSLMEMLQLRYSLNEEFKVDFLSLMLYSKIIDDFSETIFNLSKYLVGELVKRKLLDISDSWGDYSGWTMWGKL